MAISPTCATLSSEYCDACISAGDHPTSVWPVEKGNRAGTYRAFSDPAPSRGLPKPPLSHPLYPKPGHRRAHVSLCCHEEATTECVFARGREVLNTQLQAIEETGRAAIPPGRAFQKRFQGLEINRNKKTPYINLSHRKIGRMRKREIVFGLAFRSATPPSHPFCGLAAWLIHTCQQPRTSSVSTKRSRAQLQGRAHSPLLCPCLCSPALTPPRLDLGALIQDAALYHVSFLRSSSSQHLQSPYRDGTSQTFPWEHTSPLFAIGIEARHRCSPIESKAISFPFSLETTNKRGTVTDQFNTLTLKRDILT